MDKDKEMTPVSGQEFQLVWTMPNGSIDKGAGRYPTEAAAKASADNRILAGSGPSRKYEVIPVETGPDPECMVEEAFSLMILAYIREALDFMADKHRVHSMKVTKFQSDGYMAGEPIEEAELARILNDYKDKVLTTSDNPEKP